MSSKGNNEAWAKALFAWRAEGKNVAGEHWRPPLQLFTGLPPVFVAMATAVKLLSRYWISRQRALVLALLGDAWFFPCVPSFDPSAPSLVPTHRADPARKNNFAMTNIAIRKLRGCWLLRMVGVDSLDQRLQQINRQCRSIHVIDKCNLVLS